MHTYSSHHRTGTSPVARGSSGAYLQEHVDPYASDTLVTQSSASGPRRTSALRGRENDDRDTTSVAAGATPRPRTVFAPVDLYTPSDRASVQSLNAASSQRRVVVNELANAAEPMEKKRYNRDASPPTRPPLVQVYNPEADPVTSPKVPVVEAPRTRGPGSKTPFPPPTPNPSLTSGDGSRAPLARRDTLVSSFDHAVVGATQQQQQQQPLGQMEDGVWNVDAPFSPPARAKHSHPSQGKRNDDDNGDDNDDTDSTNHMLASTSRPHSQLRSVNEAHLGEGLERSGRRASAATALGTRPVLDLFSAVEEENPKPATGPLAVSTHTIQNAKYVAQSAYTQRNPFRVQTFADFAAHPLLDPPEHFEKYPEAVTDAVALGSTTEGNRAMLGEFLINRMVDLTQPMSESERNHMIDLLNSTLDTLQTGDWFYKWTRTNSVHRRYFWLNMQRGTLAWSPSPNHSLVWNSEIKISEVTSIKPDCIRDASTGRSFYRMFIATASRAVCLATELPEKFDCWFKALEQLTLPNLSSGVPGMWGRPTSVLNNGRRGALGRWSSRYSPLQAIADGTAGAVGGADLRPGGRVSSSD